MEGFCPKCNSPGTLNALCETMACRVAGYHAIDDDYYQKLVNAKTDYRDPNIGLKIDDYLCVSILGRGSYGKVYLALQMPIAMKAALKILTFHNEDEKLQADALSKFEGEALSLAKLNHPNVVRLLRYGSHGGAPYLVMEFVDGATTLKLSLDAQIRQGGGFDFKIVQHVVTQILNGLESAHRQQIIHRDIKPENIMLQRVAGDDNLVRVVDFGMAKFVEHRQDTAFILGTPAYMAPEQVTRRNIGPWTDLYAVGVICVEMLMGMRLFRGGDIHEMLRAKMDATYDPLAGVQADLLPPGALPFFRRCLAHSPQDRFRDAGAFRAEMKRLFESWKQENQKSIVLTDLHKLLNDSARLELDQQREKLELERAELSQKMQEMAQERQQLESMRHQISQSQTYSVPQQFAQPAARSGPGPAVWIGGIVGAVVAALVVFFIMKSGETPERKERKKGSSENINKPGPIAVKPPPKQPTPNKPTPNKPTPNKPTPVRPSPTPVNTGPGHPGSGGGYQLQNKPPPVRKLTPTPAPKGTFCSSTCNRLGDCLRDLKQENADAQRRDCFTKCPLIARISPKTLFVYNKTANMVCAKLGRPPVPMPTNPKTTRRPTGPSLPIDNSVNDCATLCTRYTGCYRSLKHIPYTEKSLQAMKRGCLKSCATTSGRLASFQLYRMNLKLACDKMKLMRR